MKTGQKGIELIKKWEGFRSNPYLCPAKIPTIGYGNTTYLNGERVKLTDDPISEKEATKLLIDSLNRYESIVNNSIKIQLSQNQFDALVSHTYNTGGSEKLFSLINVDNPAFRWWWVNKYITSKGVKLRGLEDRRKDELKLYLS